MTDIDSNGETADPVDVDEVGPDLLAPDYILATLVELGNDAGLEVGIRLFVGGLVLSGTLVSGAKYFDDVAQAIEGDEPVGENGSNALAGLFKQVANKYRALTSDEDDDLTVEYIHLQDAWSHSPGQNPLVVGSWRGRLSKIDGWALGTYAQNN